MEVAHSADKFIVIDVSNAINAIWDAGGRVGHSILFRSECSVLFRSFKECNVLFRSFFEFLATYETQKNVLFFSKERKRTQRMQHSFAKNVKERKERNILLQRT